MNKLSGFGDSLSELMREKGVKSDKLAAAVGVTGSVVRRWTYNDTNILLSNLVNVADYFLCSVEFLLGRTEIFLDYTPKECPPFYERLRAVMKICEKTTYRVYRDTKIKGSHFSKWRNGTEPKLSSLLELSAYFDCTIDYLIGRVG
jgi:transcriptional regulator with XRE-family HTH domain